jgi:hypothetical protein
MVFVLDLEPMCHEHVNDYFNEPAIAEDAVARPLPSIACQFPFGPFERMRLHELDAKAAAVIISDPDIAHWTGQRFGRWSVRSMNRVGLVSAIGTAPSPSGG